MVAVKGMKIPESCIDCPFVKAEGTKFFCRRIMKYIDKDNLGNKHDDCPLVEIVTCEHCKSECTEKNGEKFSETRPNFFCADAERRE